MVVTGFYQKTTAKMIFFTFVSINRSQFITSSLLRSTQGMTYNDNVECSTLCELMNFQEKQH